MYPFGVNLLLLAVVLVLVVVLIAALVLVVVLVIVLVVLILRIVLVLVIHFEYLRFILLRQNRKDSLPNRLGFILCLKNKTD